MLELMAIYETITLFLPEVRQKGNHSLFTTIGLFLSHDVQFKLLWHVKLGNSHFGTITFKP